MRLIQSHSVHTRLYTFSKLKGLMVCLGLPNRMTYFWDVISRVVIGRDPFNVRQLELSEDLTIAPLYSVANLRNLTLYNPNLDIINVNVYTKFG